MSVKVYIVRVLIRKGVGGGQEVSFGSIPYSTGVESVATEVGESTSPVFGASQGTKERERVRGPVQVIVLDNRDGNFVYVLYFP